MTKKPMKVREAKGLPNDIAASLGRMISRFSLLEIILSRIMYDLAGVGPKVGRVAMGAPRVGDYPRRMQQLAEILDIDLSPFPWNEYKKTLENLKVERDVFAHSVWLVNLETGKHIIQETSGVWPASPPNTKPLSKKIMPQGRVVTPDDLRKLRKDIDMAIEQARSLRRFVAMMLQTYVETRRAPQELDHPHSSHRGEGWKAPPKPSRA